MYWEEEQLYKNIFEEDTSMAEEQLTPTCSNTYTQPTFCQQCIQGSLGVLPEYCHSAFTASGSRKSTAGYA